ncbi:hypothetical protein [Janthinobacterium sp. UMAB-56]|uniref:hypothetical protein n=1 Tax=Janthinobacterium sp. UMAB-56 TaxID=1365361 RepID=UPI001C5642FE|nr:hypothetical protein [Janthinobacterium sp. UMAB-56]
MTPPTHLDGARVLAWAWSELPFGHVSDAHGGAAPVAIHGLAVCRYEDEARVYRFSCAARWDTVQDEVYASENDARGQLPAQYRAMAAAWNLV